MTRMNVPPPMSNYPRNGAAPGGSRPPAPYLEYIGDAFRMVTSNLGPFVGGSAIAMVAAIAIYLVTMVPMAGLLVATDPGGNSPTPALGMFVIVYLVVIGLMFGLISCFFSGMVHCALEVLDHGSTSLSTISKGFSKFAATFAVGIIVGIASYIGSLLCILPGIAVNGIFMFASALPSLRGTSVGDSLKTSIEWTKSNWLMYAVVYFITGIVAGLGGIACGVGIVFTLPILPIVVAMHYRDIRDASSMQMGSPFPGAPGL
jgi:uncharacterized membrane protein